MHTCKKQITTMNLTHIFPIFGIWPALKGSTMMSKFPVFLFRYLPVYAPAVCAPADLTGALAPGIHHTAQCFSDSGFHGL